MSTTGFIDEWEVWQYAARKSELTVTERVRVLRHLSEETGRDPATLEPLDIVRWYSSHAQDWSDSTHATYHSYLSVFYKWLQLMEYRADNPLIKVGSPKAPARVARPVGDTALMDVLKANMHHRTRVMILLMTLAGLRCSEVARFKGENLDLGRNRMLVAGKHKSLNYLPLHNILSTTAETMPDRGWWFPANSTRPGQHVLPKSVSQIVGQTIRRAGVNATGHQLRHWYGSTLLADGANIRVVQELLRHKSLASTMIYTLATDERMHEAIGTLDPFRAVA